VTTFFFAEMIQIYKSRRVSVDARNAR